MIPGTFFDRNLRKAESRLDARHWLEIDLKSNPGDDTHYCEIRTRFLLATGDRYRRKALRVADAIARTQQLWGSEHKVVFYAFGHPSVIDAPALPDAIDFPHVTVVKVECFDEHLRPLRRARQRLTLLVALVHPTHLPAHHYCLIRTRHLLHAKGRGARRALAVVDSIAAVQRRWIDQLGAQFFPFGQIHPYVVATDTRSRRITVTRAYGKKSRLARAEDATALYNALEVVARVWDAYLSAPSSAHVRTFGLDHLTAALSDAAGAHRALLNSVDEARQSQSFTDYEASQVRSAIARGALTTLPSRLRGALARSPRYPNKREVKPPSASAVVYRLLHAILRDDDAASRFTRTRKRGDLRPRADRRLIDLVGRELGHEMRRRRPRPSGAIDTRLVNLVARMLAIRYHHPAKTVLKTIVRPALALPQAAASAPTDLSGFLIDSIEDTLRK